MYPEITDTGSQNSSILWFGSMEHELQCSQIHLKSHDSERPAEAMEAPLEVEADRCPVLKLGQMQHESEQLTEHRKTLCLSVIKKSILKDPDEQPDEELVLQTQSQGFQVGGDSSNSFIHQAFADYLLCMVEMQRKGLMILRGTSEVEWFDKGYSYNIRHSFGKEGKRTDYTPFSCLKIILTNPPSQGDYHGCPFRHSDPELLKQKLQSYKISPGGISQILDLVKGTHYHIACQKYFEMTHNVDDCGFSLNHPNQFFYESQRILNGGKDIKKEAVQPETPQHKPNVQKTKDASSALASLNSSLETEMEGIEDYFSE
ncbi:DNA primase large subunit-like [Eulemur rufifrons]|uniref:DNA primase large subunit-like n=1 Tax=Eulemur rufifrons TaxID=859984 RepID=UPI0037424853